MITRSPRFPLVRGSMLGALALTAILAACEASMPTAADVKNMDVTALESKARAVHMDFGEKADYFVNGEAVTAAEAKAIAPEKIAGIRVIKHGLIKDGHSAEEKSQVRIVTKDAPEGTDGFDLNALAEASTNAGEQRIMIRKRADGTDTTAVLPGDVLIRTGDGAQPLFLLDGVPADQAAIARLNPSSILSIDVLKGPTAEKLYGARGANGVVKVTTKK